MPVRNNNVVHLFYNLANYCQGLLLEQQLLCMYVLVCLMTGEYHITNPVQDLVHAWHRLDNQCTGMIW